MAEIIRDRRVPVGLVHCVVQRQGSREILFLQQFNSSEEAERAVEEFMEYYRRAHPRSKKSAA